MPRVAKGKKKAQGIEADEVAALLSVIHQQGLSEPDILRILKVDKPACDPLKSPCRANKKDNALCFCQLVPAETSFRKKGLWQKEQTYLNTLGSDPVEQRREDAANPAGLRNLGNTCYANAALQCLFSIPSLRNSVYHAEPQVAAHDIFRQLQSLFLQLQFGPRSSVDTEALAKTLGLNHAVQQDGQEFLKLLLTRVEQLLSKSSNQAAKGLVRQLFRGGLSYVTTCQRCGRDSASSRDVQDFYDLMPQVRGYTGLTQSLASLLHADALTGDNQYRCEFCSDKVDALRHVRLRSLPPYLCLALQRFYFDTRTADKAKALDKFAFPLHLDFRQVLAEAAAAAALDGDIDTGGGSSASTTTATATAAAAQEVPQYAAGSGPVYELVGILIHKGSQASSGHYVAHIKDQASGQWWRFDDETAERIGPDPTAAFQQDHGAGGGNGNGNGNGNGGGSTAAAGAGGTEATEKAPKGTRGSGSSRRRAAAPLGEDPSDADPDYVDEEAAPREPQNDSDDAEGRSSPARGPRGGRKRGAPSKGKRGGGRPAKRGGGGGGRGRRGAVAAAAATTVSDGEDEGDEEMRRAMQASLALHNQSQIGGGGGNGAAGGGGGAGLGDEEAALQRALAASMVGQQPPGNSQDAVMAAVMAESARVHAEAGAAAAGTAGAPEGAVDGGVLPAWAVEGKDVVMAEGDKEGADVPTPRRPSPKAVKHEEAQPQQQQQPAQADIATMPPGPSIVSANAYMLVYRAVGFAEPPAVADVSQLLVPELREAVSEQAAAFLEQCDVYVRQRQALKEQVESRRRTVREVMSCIVPHLPGQPPPPQQPAVAAAAAAVAAAPPSPLSEHPQHPGQQHEAAALTDLPPNVSSGDGGGCSSSPDAATAAPAAAPDAAVRQDTCGFWVSTAWLERWANDEGSPPAIDNSCIVCTKHGPADAAGAAASANDDGGGGSSSSVGGSGAMPTRGSRLDPGKVSAAKLVSPLVWSRLQAAHGGGPELAAGDVCVECLASSFNATLLGSQADQVRARVAALLEEASGTAAEDEGRGGGGGDDWSDGGGGSMEEAKGSGRDGAGGEARGYWVSRSWLQGWSKRQGTSIKAETSPTAALLCPHGQLLPASLYKTARRIAVPPDIWRFVRDLWVQQRLREAEDEARAATTAAAGAAGATGGSGGGDSAVDCLDLTGDEEPKPPPPPPPAADDDDDDVIDTTPEPPQPQPPPKPPLPPPPPRHIPTVQELAALCPEVPVGRLWECSSCRLAAGEAAVAQADNRKQLETERVALGGLAAEVVPYLEYGEQYYMVPSVWVREWQLYVRGAQRRGNASAAATAASGSNAPNPVTATSAGSAAAAASTAPAAAAGPSRPGPVSEAMLRVLCPCHPEEPRLGVPMPRLAVKRNKWVCQQDPEQDPLRLITASDWAQVRKLYGNPAATTEAAVKIADGGGGGGARRSRAPRGKGAAATVPSGPPAAATSGAAPVRFTSSNDSDVILLDSSLPSREPPQLLPAVGDAGAGGGGADDTGGRSSAAPAAATHTAQQLAAVQQGFFAELILPTGEADDPHANVAMQRQQQRDAALAAASTVPELRVWPPVCAEALAAHGRATKEALLSYSEAEVLVEMVAQEELEASLRDSGNGLERKSRRSRRGRTAITVSNTTTLEQLKLQIFQNLSVHPRNQTLYVRGEGGCPRVLEGDDLSLAQHEVLPGQEIRLVRGSAVDDDDVCELLGEGRANKRRQVEEGFKNTALHGDLPQQQQQQDQQPQQQQQRPAGEAGDGPAVGSSGTEEAAGQDQDYEPLSLVLDA